jgi:hypothetical protein
VITLCAGLALLGLLAWAFSGGGGKPTAAKKAAQTSGALPTAAHSGTTASGTAASLPGCVTVASSARPGTYQVQARDASVASPVRTFKLGH